MEQPPKASMTPQQALENITMITGLYKGTRAEHAAIMESIKVLAEAITPKAEKGS